MSARVRKPVILLVENEENDVFFFRRALDALQFNDQVKVVPNVSRARAYLEGAGQFSDRRYFPLPDLIVSDFKMPGGSGVQFLDWLRAHPVFRDIPFVLFSGSALPRDLDAALQAGARGYFVKSGDFSEMRDTVQKLLTHVPPEKHP